MGKEIKNEYGVIDISRDVIATVAGLAAMECFGVVGMVSARVISDGIAELLGRESLSKGVEVAIAQDKLSIKVNIVVGYGIKIPVVASSVTDNVRNRVEKFTGLHVHHIEVDVRDIRVLD